MTGSRVYPSTIWERYCRMLGWSDACFDIGTLVLHPNGHDVGEIISGFSIGRRDSQTIRWLSRNGQEQWMDAKRLKKASPLHALASLADKDMA